MLPSEEDLMKTLKSLSHRHSLFEVWTDWLMMMATTISNAIDHRQSIRKEREDEYLRVVGKYTPNEVQTFAECFAKLILLLEHRVATGERIDVLSHMFMSLELGNKWAGQFFTPYPVAFAMALMSFSDLKSRIEEQGYITMLDPASGGGVMLAATYAAMREEGLNPCSQVHVTAVDIDLRAVHMTYVQLATLGMPAIVIHGNSLTGEEWSRWFTPMHLLGFWQSKLARASSQQNQPPTIKVEPSGQLTLF